MDSRKKLSPRQKVVLDAIERHRAETGASPSFRELAKLCGDVAVGTIQDHVRALTQKGFLEESAGRARAFKSTLSRETFTIPILGTVPAGNPIEATENFLGALPYPADSARSRDGLFALKVRGASMQDAGILDGDFVVVRQQSVANDGEIVVAMIEGEVTVKRLEKKRGRAPRLLPENDSFSPIEISLHELERGSLIVGRVLSVQRFLD